MKILYMTSLVMAVVCIAAFFATSDIDFIIFSILNMIAALIIMPKEY